MKKPTTFPTNLQDRLAGMVRAGLADTRRTQHDLSRCTGIGEPHISLLLSGKCTGSPACWDTLISAATTAHT